MADGTFSTSAIARVRGRSGRVVGAAYLVTSDLAVTCAHVVTAALDGNHFDAEPPIEAVDLSDEYGVWIEAELRARQGAGWLQIESAPQRRTVGPGFSGSAVWSPDAGGIVGVVVAAESGAGNTTAYLVPTRTASSSRSTPSTPAPGSGTTRAGNCSAP